jgi:ketosteroid isomerase-like protein
MLRSPARFRVLVLAPVAFAGVAAVAARAQLVPTATGVSPSTAQATRPAPPAADVDAVEAIGRLRAGLIDAFNRQDLDALLSFLAPDVVLTWQNGEVCRGPGEVRAYYDRMMKGDKAIVARVMADPVVDGRQVYGDWALSHGHMRDHFILSDGKDLPFDSQFTAVVARRGDRWLVTGFHLSVNAFDNPVMNEGVRRGATYGAVGGLVVGAVVGAVGWGLLGRWRRRRHRRTEST